MKAFELFTKSQKSAEVWACGGCRRIYVNEDLAKKCCVCVDCDKEERSPHRLWCDACIKKHLARLAAEQKQKKQDAMKIAEIVDGKFGLFYGDKYLKDVEDVGGELSPDDVMPEFCFAAKPIRFRKWDIDEFLDNEDEQYGLEDSGEIPYVGLDDLRGAFREFNERNAGRPMCYAVDYKRKVKTADESRKE